MKLEENMRGLLTVLSILFLSVTCYAEGQIKAPQLGFRTVDFSSDFWASVKDDDKMKGSVSELLTYADIEEIFVIRCNMAVPIGDYLERTIQSSIPAGQQFSVGPIPEGMSRDLRFPLLTVVFETKKGDLGLLTLYPGMTIVELNGRYGMLLRKE